MWLMLASASPRNPYVAMVWRSSYFCSLDVVKRSHRMGRSSFCWLGEWWSGKVTERKRGESHVNATTIVGNLQQLQSSVLDKDLEGRGACVDSIFHQFLQSVHRR